MPVQRAADRLERAGRDVPGNDRIRHAGEPSVPEVDVGAAHLRARRAQQRGAGRQIGPRELAELDRAGAARASPRQGCGHSRAYVTLWMCARRISFLVALTLLCAAPPAAAQTYQPPKARRHFVSVQLRLALHRAAALRRTSAGGSARQGRGEHAASRSTSTAPATRRRSIDVLEFSRAAGLGASVYPFGMSIGPTLMLRGSIGRCRRFARVHRAGAAAALRADRTAAPTTSASA